MRIIKKLLLFTALLLLLTGCVEPEVIEEPTVREYTITFETYGGTEVSPVVVKEGVAIDIDYFSSTLEGYEFLGWTLFTEQERLALGTDIHYYTGTFIPESDMNFYVGWEEIVVDVDPAEGDFVRYLNDFEDVMLFAQYLEAEEVIDIEIRNGENTVLVESTITTLMNFDFINSFMGVEVTNEFGHISTVQTFAHGDGIVTIYKEPGIFTTEILESSSFEDVVGGENQGTDLVDKPYQSVIEVDELVYEVVYNLMDYFSQAELDLMFPPDATFSYENVVAITVVYDFTDKENKIYGSKVIFDGLKYLDEYFVDFSIDIEYRVLTDFTYEILKPGDTTIQSAKSLDDVFLVFEQEDLVYFNQTAGDNIIAYRLTPGDYAVFSESNISTMGNPYLIIYDENGLEMMVGSYLHIEEETIIYLNYTAYGEYTNPRRLASIKEVTPLHDGEINPANVNGTITIEFTEDDLNQVLVFPDGTYDGIMIFDAISMNAGNKLLLVGNTRCEDTETGDICAIKTYDGSGMTINITALTEGSVTFTYRLVEYDEISMDSMNPTPIDSIYNGIHLENNEEYYIEFDSTGDTYNFDLKILHPGYYVTYTATLIDSGGNIIEADWDDDLYLDAGTYTVKITAFGFHSAVLPIVEVVD